MRAFRQLLAAKASNWAVCLLSASLMAVAVSNWTRPSAVSAQAGAAARTKMSGESRQVIGALEDAFVHIAETVEPSVVTISARSAARRPAAPMQNERAEPPNLPDVPEPFRDFFRRIPRPDSDGGPNARPSHGSGVIIRETGNVIYILTNNHVVDGRDKFTVQFYDKSEAAGELVGVDEKSDLAVLKCTLKRPLPAGSVARLGDSEKVKVGQWAIAIGSPLGYESTLTVGVISAKGRRLDGVDARSFANYADLIQTDASINPGNSGGPLVNIDGEVVGINVAIASSGMSRGSIGIGFAIPVNTCRMVVDQLITRGKVVRGFLGVQVSTANRELSQELKEHLGVPEGGALVESVSPDAPASRGGVKDGDVIVRFGDRKVCSFDDLERAVGVTPPGSTVPVEVIRDGKPVRLNITVVERPAERELIGKLNGGDEPAAAEKAPEPIRSKFGLSIRPAADGVEIVGVAPGSPAEEAGLQPGFTIVSVGKTATKNVAAFQGAVNAVKPGEGVVLRVRTPAGLRFVVLKP